MDRGNKKLLSNVIYSGVAQLLFFIAPLLTTPYVARIFSATELGYYATSYSIAMFFVQLASFGIPIYGSRKIAQIKSSELRTTTFFSIWFLQLVTTVVFFLCYLLLIFIFFRDNKIYFVQAFLILACITDISWFFIGIEEIKKNIIRNFLSKLVTIVFIFLLIRQKSDLLLYTWINILGVFLGNISMVVQLKPFLIVTSQKKVLKKSMVLESFGLLIPIMTDSAKNAFSRVVLATFGNYKDAGLFDQGLKIVQVLNGVLQSITTAIMPRLTSLVAEKNYSEVFKLVDYFVKVSTFVITIIICGVISTSSYFVPLFFCPGYASVSCLMDISSISLLFTGLSFFLGKGLLLSFSKDKQFRIATYISAGVLSISNIMFVPFYGAVGASLSFVLSSIVYFVVIFFFLRLDISNTKVLNHVIYAIVVIAIWYFADTYILKMNINLESNLSGFIIYGIIAIFGVTILFLPKILKERVNLNK